MRFLFAVLLATTSAVAVAQNWGGLLKNTPAEKFNEEDQRIFLDATRRALNEGSDNETVSWENPGTHSRGDITVLRSFDWQTYRCKELRLHNEAGGWKQESTLNLCHVDEKWRLVSPSELKK